MSEQFSDQFDTNRQDSLVDDILAAVEAAHADRLNALYARMPKAEHRLIDEIQQAELALREDVLRRGIEAAFGLGYRLGVTDHAMLMLNSRK